MPESPDLEGLSYCKVASNAGSSAGTLSGMHSHEQPGAYFGCATTAQTDDVGVPGFGTVDM